MSGAPLLFTIGPQMTYGQPIISSATTITVCTICTTRAGLKPDQMRVASPFNDYSKESLNLYRIIDPEIWTKLVGRVRGANFAAIYSKTKAMGYRNITLPEGHTWESYTRFLLDTLPKRLRNNYIRKFNTSIRFWHETGGGLSEETIQELKEKATRYAATAYQLYTAQKSRIIFLDKLPDHTMILKAPKIFPAGSACATVF